MKHPNLKSSKSTSNGSQCTPPLRIRTRRSYRNICSKSRLSPCPEEATKVTHTTDVCANVHSSDQILTVCNHKFSQQLLSVDNISSNFISPIKMPPGPHTSPVPSPPPISVPSDELFLHENIDSEALPVVDSTPSTSHCHTKCSSSVRRRLARRRNAICDTTLSKGLNDFFVSYVVSNLTDSMTSALNLDVSGNPVTSAAAAPGHNFITTSTVPSLVLSTDTDTSME